MECKFAGNSKKKEKLDGEIAKKKPELQKLTRAKSDSKVRGWVIMKGICKASSKATKVHFSPLPPLNLHLLQTTIQLQSINFAKC